MSTPDLFSDNWHQVADRRFALRPDCPAHRQTWRGRRWWVLRDPYTNRFFRLAPAAWTFLRQLDGRQTLDTVWRRALEADPAATPGQAEVLGLLSELTRAGLLRSDEPAAALPALFHDDERKRRERGAAWFNFLFLRLPLVDPSPVLNRLLPLFRIVAHRWGLGLWLALVAAGLTAVLGRTDALGAQGAGLLARDNLLWLYLAWLGVKLWHEFGHGLICRHFGGEVHTLGVMLLVFTPVPYVDATAAWGFRRRRERLLTGAGGMLFELGLAALAALVWAHTHDAFLHQLSYNIMLIASVSTLLFNLNPLLKFDGYYLLSDLLDLPNLAQRSQQQLQRWAETRLFGLTDSVRPAESRREAGWLATYGIASTAYRLVLLTIIIDTVARAFLGLGLILAALALVFWFVLPIGRFVRYALTDPRLRVRRPRVLGVLSAAALLAAALLFALPLPDRFTADGILVAGQRIELITATAGWVNLPTTNTAVAAGTTVLRLNDPTRAWERDRLQAAVAEAQVRLQLAQDSDPSLLPALRASLQARQTELAQLEQRIADANLQTPFAGQLFLRPTEELRGHYLSQGTPCGALYDFSELQFEAVIRQTDAARLFEEPLGRVQVKLRGQPAQSIDATMLTIRPAQSDQLPSASLGFAAGGDLPIDPNDPRGLRPTEPFFLVTLALPADADLPHLHALEGRARFGFARHPLGLQWWRRLHQLLLTRYQL